MSEDFQNTFVPPLQINYSRHLPWGAPFGWLKAAVSDFFIKPALSLVYGIGVFCVSAALIFGMYHFDVFYILLPALAGFMVMGPALATGLYEKSRLIEAGEPVSFKDMIFVEVKSAGQILFIGVILMLVVMLWLRAAFLLYALFFGMLPFEGFDTIISTVLTTPRGWALLGVGGLVGGLFAAFSFAISAYSIPMLLNKRLDAFTAMGTSWALAWNNKGVAIVWGLIVILLFVLCLLTGLLGLIFIFPLLGHGTWHAYRAISVPSDETSAAQ